MSRVEREGRLAVFGLDFRSKVEEEGMCRGVCLGLIFKWSECGI